MASNLVSLHILATPVKPVQTSFWLQDCDFQDDPLVPSQTQAFVGEVVYLLVFCPGGKSNQLRLPRALTHFGLAGCQSRISNIVFFHQS